MDAGLTLPVTVTGTDRGQRSQVGGCLTGDGLAEGIDDATGVAVLWADAQHIHPELLHARDLRQQITTERGEGLDAVEHQEGFALLGGEQAAVRVVDALQVAVVFR